MNIVFGVPELGIDSKYTSLELDTFILPGHNDPVTAYCVLENIPIMEMSDLEDLKNRHQRLMANYRLGYWDLCQDDLLHLNNRWGGEMNTFYADLGRRINTMREKPLPDQWNGVIDKTVSKDTV